MSLANQKAKDSAMASYMKQNAARYPDSIRRPHNGCGASDRKAAAALGSSWRGRSSSTWDRGMLGGVLAARLGYGSDNIPPELLKYCEVS